MSVQVPETVPQLTANTGCVELADVLTNSLQLHGEVEHVTVVELVKVCPLNATEASAFCGMARATAAMRAMRMRFKCGSPLT